MKSHFAPLKGTINGYSATGNEKKALASSVLNALETTKIIYHPLSYFLK